MTSGPLVEGVDFYYEDGLVVLTAGFLRRRGFCCGSGCRHCPYPERVQAATMRRRAEGATIDSVDDMDAAVAAYGSD